MRITVTYNQRVDSSESQAELLSEEDVARLVGALEELGHEVARLEVSTSLPEIVDRLVESRPTLVFNVAEGLTGRAREAQYPAIFEQLGLPYTGGDASLLYVDLDKNLANKILLSRGVRVPRGVLITREQRSIPDEIDYPVIVKPNFEGSSKGITEDSICDSREQAEARALELLEEYPAGIDVEEFIAGRELTVPMLQTWPGRLIEVVEHVFPGEGDRAIFDFARKREGKNVEVICPAKLSHAERRDVLALADRALSVMRCPDVGRVDIRMDRRGVPYLIELNPLPSLHPEASLMVAGAAKGLEYRDVIGKIVESAARRYGIVARSLSQVPRASAAKDRITCREAGRTIGRFPTGKHNAITDIEGVKVGHVTHWHDDVPSPDGHGTTRVRTGITAVVPDIHGDLFNNHLVAGGFVLNGTGDMSGLIQAMEWGWLETPILLTNTMSLGRVHSGIIQYMIDRYPDLGRKVDVIIPLVAETNDAFLNDVRVPINTAEDAIHAIECAEGGPVEQGSVGGGTGMITFDFAGGIGTSSRVVKGPFGTYKVGVLVQSNFGKMRNLTIDGQVIGRELDSEYPTEGRRRKNYGSIITVVATDAPLLNPQLNRLSRRAALGLGRTGSFAASTSGEIVFAFSTGNAWARAAKERASHLSLTFVPDEQINPLYEATVEATEEAVINAICCSKGVEGQHGRVAPAFPLDCLARPTSEDD